jgi:hypothetical protein
MTTTTKQETRKERGDAVRAINLQWYADRAAHGSAIADELLSERFAAILERGAVR